RVDLEDERGVADIHHTKIGGDGDGKRPVAHADREQIHALTRAHLGHWGGEPRGRKGEGPGRWREPINQRLWLTGCGRRSRAAHQGSDERDREHRATDADGDQAPRVLLTRDDRQCREHSGPLKPAWCGRLSTLIHASTRSPAPHSVELASTTTMATRAAPSAAFTETTLAAVRLRLGSPRWRVRRRRAASGSCSAA